MPTFMDEDFLLHSEYARTLYHQYAKTQPIIDYHSHLSPQDIANDRNFENITAAWLHGDHYKWRAMRALGVNEEFITGRATDEEKFSKWAYTVPYTMRNPLYHWTHLELKRYFNITDQLTPGSSDAIYQQASAILRQRDHSTRCLLKKMKVEVVCTTDDPVDSLEDHKKIKAGNSGIVVLPTFRPDKSFAVEDPATWKAYINRLGRSCDVEINSFSQMMVALEKRIRFFASHGCKLSDHGLERLHFPSREEHFDIEMIFRSLLSEKELNKSEREYFKYQTLLELCRLYHQAGWTQQFHLGAIRNNNERLLKKLGPDTGFDSIGDFPQASAMSAFFNELEKTDQLTKTIVYNLNPSYNEVFATMMGNFNDGSIKGKMQFGSAWWFLDQKDGMEKQINSLSNLGLLSCFIGMLTDSRSFLSFPRHEYFRRILCNIIGNDVSQGELPWDEKWLGQLVGDISYNNSKSYFNF